MRRDFRMVRGLSLRARLFSLLAGTVLVGSPPTGPQGRRPRRRLLRRSRGARRRARSDHRPQGQQEGHRPTLRQPTTAPFSSGMTVPRKMPTSSTTTTNLSRFGFKGNAKTGWRLALAIGLRSSPRGPLSELNQFDADNANDGAGPLNVRHSFMYLSSKTRVRVAWA